MSANPTVSPGFSFIGVFLAKQCAVKEKVGSLFERLPSFFEPAISRRRLSGWPPNFASLVSRAPAIIPPKMGSIGQKKNFFHFSHTFLLIFRRLVWEKNFLKGISLIFGVKVAIDEKQ